MSFLDSDGLAHVIQKLKQSLSGFVPTTRTVNGKALSSNITLTAANVSARPSSWTPTAAEVGALPITGGTLTGDLIIKGSGNYGTKINLGDGDYVHFSEPTDDCLEIKAKKVNFVLSDTTDAKFTINGTNPFAALSSGGGSGSMEVISYKGAGNANLVLTYSSSEVPIGTIIFGNAFGVTSSDYPNIIYYAPIVFNPNGSSRIMGMCVTSNLSNIAKRTSTASLDTATKRITISEAADSYFDVKNVQYCAALFF